MLTHCRLCAVSHRPQNQLSSVRFRTLSPVPSPPPTDGVDSFLRCRLLRHCSNSRCYRCRSLRSYSRCYCSSRCHRRHRRYQCYCCYCCCCNCRCPPSVGFWFFPIPLSIIFKWGKKILSVIFSASVLSQFDLLSEKTWSRNLHSALRSYVFMQ